MSNVDTVDPLDTLTGETTASAEEGEGGYQPALTILYHPNLLRVGERALLPGLEAGQVESLSRLAPAFSRPGLQPERSLRDPYISRRPIQVRAVGDDLEIRAAAGVPLSVEGRAVTERLRLPRCQLDEGVVLEIAQRVVLLLHRAPHGGPGLDPWGLVGESAAALELRRHIARVADLGVSVLIRGETGVGKERVAQAIHAASRRAERPLVAVNMAALAPGTAASELFGHEKGAFTGASGRHAGLFERAQGGTLFLDEIGETPVEIQTMLLRTLSEGAIRPLGGRTDRAADVRVLAATDADLEKARAAGAFRAALLYRLAGYEIQVPSLRERREDIPRLVVHFLREALATLGESHRLEARPASRRPWFPPALMMRLYRHDWPGNVRQLRNTVQQLVIANRGAESVDVDTGVARILAKGSEQGERVLLPHGRSRGGSSSRSGAAGEQGDRRLLPHGLHGRVHAPQRRRSFGRDTLIEALRACSWSVPRAAERLGVPRATLYSRIERMPDIRKATDFSRTELVACLQEHDRDLDAMAAHLRVSKRSLKLRMRALGLA